jgi:hypothetical protein
MGVRGNNPLSKPLNARRPEAHVAHVRPPGRGFPYHLQNHLPTTADLLETARLLLEHTTVASLADANRSSPRTSAGSPQHSHYCGAESALRTVTEKGRRIVAGWG